MCLEELSHQDLKNVLDYMYNGEVHIYQEELDRFLSVAQRLRLEGLLETEENEKSEDIRPEEEHFVQNTSPEITEENIQPSTSNITFQNKTVSLNKTEMSDINAKLFEHLESLGDGHFSCRICGKDSTGMKKTPNYLLKHKMRNHVETHIEGLSYTCQLCGKECRSKQSLYDHRRRQHNI